MPFGPGMRSATQPGLAKPLYPTWAESYNNRTCGTWPANADSGLTRYEQFLSAITNDERFQRDVVLGKRIGLYKFRGELGMGNFSRVKLAFHQLAHEQVAVKIIDKSGMDQRALRMLLREISTMDSVQHPAIVRLYEVMETISKVYLVMEIAPCGEMYSRITNEGKYDECKASLLFAQLISAVDYMHENDLFHRDIKAENVFLSTSDRVKLGDFGFSTRIIRQSDNPDPLLTTFCGSPPYAAPELFNDDAYSGGPVDVWALGVLLFFMVTASMPFQAQTVTGLKQSILENSYVIPSFVSGPCADLIRGILQSRPQERLTITSIKSSCWFKTQSFMEPLPLVEFVPSSDKSQITERENRVRVRLQEIGITEDLLVEHREKGGRSPVIGTYRILMHRMNRESCDTSSANDTINISGNENVNSADCVACSKMNATLLPVPSSRSPSKQKIKHKLVLSMGWMSKKNTSRTSSSRSCAIL